MDILSFFHSASAVAALLFLTLGSLYLKSHLKGLLGF